MLLQRKSQSGIGHILLLGAIVIVMVVAYVGWKVVDSNGANDSLPTNAATSATPAANTLINNQADLNSASTSLDQASIDSDLNPSALDSDVNSLL